MLIGLKYKFIFVANSKTASTSIESVLEKYADISEKIDPKKTSNLHSNTYKL